MNEYLPTDRNTIFYRRIGTSGGSRTMALPKGVASDWKMAAVEFSTAPDGTVTMTLTRVE